MRISFDLDDTIILTGDGCLYEAPLKFPYSLFYKEQLRSGMVALCKELVSLGWEICIYTTSERSVNYIRNLFKQYGISLYNIINQQIHQEIVQGTRKEIQPSKFPSRFGIDLHIDDDRSVKQNGLQYGFNVLIIDRKDEQWTSKILDEAIRIIKRKESMQNHF